MHVGMEGGREGGREKTVLALFFCFCCKGILYRIHLSPGSPGW